MGRPGAGRHPFVRTRCSAAWVPRAMQVGIGADRFSGGWIGGRRPQYCEYGDLHGRDATVAGGNDAARRAENGRCPGLARRLFKAIDDGVGQSETWRGQAQVLLSLGKYAEAATAAGRGGELAVSRDEQDAEIRALLAQAEAWSRLGELERAAQLAERAIGRFGGRREGFGTDLQRTGQESLISPAYPGYSSTGCCGTS